MPDQQQQAPEPAEPAKPTADYLHSLGMLVACGGATMQQALRKARDVGFIEGQIAATEHTLKRLNELGAKK